MPPVPARPLVPAARSALAVLVVLVLVALGSCSEPEVAAPVARPKNDTVAPLAVAAASESVSVLTLPPGFVVGDTRGVILPVLPVYDVEQPPIPVYGGEANVNGVVLGPDGPVEGAVVRLERFVGNQGGYIEVTTNKEGIYNAYEVYGGHYRVRSWLEPDLTTFEAQTTFLPAEETQTIDIAVRKFDANHLTAALDRGDPHIDEPTIVHALVVNEDVRKEDGIVEGTGIKDVDVHLVAKGNLYWEILQTPVKTDEEGRADFVVICRAEGSWPMQVSTAEFTTDMEMPPCLPPEEPGSTTTTSSEPAGSSTTDTTVVVDPNAPSSSTTTTVVIPPFAIGSTFLVPFAGPVPGGQYVSTASTCVTGFQVLVQNTWIQTRITGVTINSQYAMRNFRPLDFTPGCAFTRKK